MKTNHYSLLAGLGLALCVGLGSCTDDDLASDSHYKPPVFLKGNAYEALQQEGNYSIFLRGIELSDYYGIVNGKSIVTVAAPTDEAFRKFLSEKGYQSIDDLDKSDHAYLNKLIAYHLMYYAFNWDKMVNFRPEDGDGATPDEMEVRAGYYYKHRTHCSDPVEQVRVKLTPNAVSDTLIYVYHQERYLPVFSNMLFATKGIDASYNYNYFFPDTEWKGAGINGTFNIANAKVLDDESVVTDNGYLYHIDHVIEPLNTVYEEMKSNPNYSKFLEIYDSYSVYEVAPDEVNNTLGYQAYLHNFQDLPSIATEWPVSNWQLVQSLEYAGYNVFAPTNEAIDRFFSEFWKEENGYKTVDDLDPLILQYFIRQSFTNESFIVFPEEIRKGLVTTAYGTPINIDPEEVTDRKVCCNGAFYGMNRMDMPAIFSSVVGPAFSDTTFRNYLYLLDNSSSLLALASNNTNFVTLMPSNEQMFNTTPSIRMYETTSGNVIQQFSSEDGEYVEMGSGAMKNVTDMHVAQNIKELKTTGVQVVTTNTPYNYWYVKDGKITTNALFNQILEPTYQDDPFVTLKRITYNGGQWSNGNSYSYDAPEIFVPASGDGLGHRLAVCNDKTFPYYMFAQLLRKANLFISNELSAAISPAGFRFVAFMPTNEVLTEKLNELPGCSGLTVTNGELSGTLNAANQQLLANYLKMYFVNSLTNSFTDYPFIGSTFKGEYLTVANNNMVVTDTGSSITVSLSDSDKTVNVVSTYDYLPFAFSDGCVQFIDGIL